VLVLNHQEPHAQNVSRWGAETGILLVWCGSRWTNRHDTVGRQWPGSSSAGHRRAKATGM